MWLKNKKLINYLKLAILTGALIFLLLKIDVQEILIILSGINPWLYLAAFSIFCFDLFLSSYKWKTILRMRGIHLSSKEAFFLHMKGLVFNYILPTSVGGDLIKMQSLKKKNQENTWSSLLIISFYDRLSGFFAIVFIVFISSLFIQVSAIGLISLLSLAILCLTILLFAAYSQIFNFFRKIKLSDSLARLRDEVEYSLSLFLKQKEVLWVLCLSLAFHLLGMFAHFMLFRAVNAPVTLFIVYFLIAASRLIDALPISFGGVGVRESFLVVAGAYFGLNANMIITYSLLSYSLPITIIILFLIVSITQLAKKIPRIN